MRIEGQQLIEILKRDTRNKVPVLDYRGLERKAVSVCDAVQLAQSGYIGVGGKMRVRYLRETEAAQEAGRLGDGRRLDRLWRPEFPIAKVRAHGLTWGRRTDKPSDRTQICSMNVQVFKRLAGTKQVTGRREVA